MASQQQMHIMYHKGRYDDRKYLTKYVKQLDYHNTAGIKQHYYNVHVALH